jgi:hypothetical protein
VPQNTRPRGSAITSLNLDVRSAGTSGMTSFSEPSRQIATVPRSIKRSKDPSIWIVEATYRSTLVTLLVLFALRVVTKEASPWNIGPVQPLFLFVPKRIFTGLAGTVRHYLEGIESSVSIPNLRQGILLYLGHRT